MARKIKPPDELPSKAWLMSFGDTMTTLLAFFIVLCSLAEDQSGANLHSGTGSFVRTLQSAGLPGTFSGEKSQRSVQLEATSPLYRPSDDPIDDADRGGTGPDENANDIQSKDREQEEFMRFLNEIERMATVQAEPDTTGETTFDFFEKISNAPPYLPANYNDIAMRIVPLLRKNSHRIELIVWATTPGQKARGRASLQSSRITQEIVTQAGLSPAESNRILGVARPWPYKDVKRPIVSIVIRRVSS